MRTILKVIFSAIVAVGAMVAWLLVPQLAPFGFGLGVVAAWAISLLIDGLEECDGARAKTKKGGE